MKKKFRIIAGKKFYCDEKGILLKDADQNFEEVPETDTETEEVTVEDEATEEVEKMLKKARLQVKNEASEELAESQVEAVEAVDKLFKGITASAKKVTKIASEAMQKASYDVEAAKKGIDALSKGKTQVFSFEIQSKADLDFLTKATSEADLTGDVIVPELQPEVTRDPVRSVFMESIVDLIPNMTSDKLSWVEVTDETGAPLPTAQLAAMHEKDFEFTEFKTFLKKITVVNKHSVELLKDAPQLVNAIKNWLQEDMNIVSDQQLINGNGTGENLTGVISVASVFDATAVGTKRVAEANLYDVIRVVITKIAVVGKGKFQATYVLLNPDDADSLDLTKDVNGQYILPPFRSADGTVIKGARIIENVGIPAGKFLVGDFRKMHVGTQGGVEIEMTNADGTDFTKDILTVKLRRRMAAYVRTNDNGAFWTGDISDVIGFLTA